MKKRGKTGRFRVEEHLLPVGVALVAVFWVIESVLDTFVLGEGDFLSTLFPVQPAQLWDRGLLAVVLLLFISCVQRAMSERRRAEELQSLMRSIVESSDDAIIGKDLDGVIVSWNLAAEKVYGYSADEVVGKPISVLVPPGRDDEVPAILERVRRGELTDHYETERIKKGGERIQVSLTVSPIRGSSGNVVGASTIARDVTGRKQMEEALRRSEARHRTILNAASDAVITMTADGIIRSFNRGAERIFGYSARETAGQPLKMLMPDRFREPHEAGFRRYLETGEARVIGRTVELTGLRKSGEEFPIELSIGEIREGEDLLFTGIIRDATGRKRAEEALRESEQRFKSSFEDASIGMALVGTDGRFLQVNRSLREILGYSERELLSKTFQDITHPDDLDADLVYVQRLLTGEIGTYQMEKRYFHSSAGVSWTTCRWWIGSRRACRAEPPPGSVSSSTSPTTSSTAPSPAIRVRSTSFTCSATLVRDSSGSLARLTRSTTS